MDANRKQLESWLGWIVVDTIYVPLYLSKGLYLTAILYAIFLCMAIIGGNSGIDLEPRFGLVPRRGQPEMTLGFVVGKFYPPHRGLKHLIDTAKDQVDELIVMLAAHPSQTIPGEVRYSWLREIHPDCDVRLVADELEDDSQQWGDFTLKYLAVLQTLFFQVKIMGQSMRG